MATINLQVSASADDGRCLGTSFDNALTVAAFGTNADGTVDWNAWFRFQNVTIPQGATIVSATVQLQSSGNYTATVNMKLAADDADNPGAPTDCTDLNGRTRTTAQVSWDITASWSTGGWYTSPDISSVIQEIVDRAGWASGNAILLLFDNNSSPAGNSRGFRTYDYGTTDGPKLSITYTVAAPRHPAHYMGGMAIV